MIERLLKISKTLVMMTAVVILSTVLIDAADNYRDPGHSLAGRAWEAVSGEQDTCPKGMVYVESDSSTFCIDRYPAAAGEDCP